MVVIWNIVVTGVVSERREKSAGRILDSGGICIRSSGVDNAGEDCNWTTGGVIDGNKRNKKLSELFRLANKVNHTNSDQKTPLWQQTLNLIFSETLKNWLRSLMTRGKFTVKGCNFKSAKAHNFWHNGS